MGNTTTKMMLVETDKLIPYVNNARTHSAEQIEKLRKSLREFGFINPVIIDSENNIIAGHGRVMAAKEENIKEVPCVLVDFLTEAQKKAYILADNRMAMDAGWNEELLREELNALQESMFDISLTGFDVGELEVLMFPEDEVKEDEYPCLEANSVGAFTQLGDRWHLGNHILYCGDSTKAEDTKSLMDGVIADMYLTDPPYNVDFEAANGKKIQNDKMSNEQFRAFLSLAFENASGVLKPGAPYYIWHSDREGINFRESIALVGEHRETLIWSKNSFVLSRNDYHYKHDSCLYGWKDGAPHYFINDRTQSTIINQEELNIDKMKVNELRELLHKILEESPTTVIEEARPVRDDDHPTMKPIKLLARLIKNSSKSGEVVFDNFGGSGSTLIACEQLNRTCYMMELDPKYCDVIVNRYISFVKSADNVFVERDGQTYRYSELTDETPWES